MESEERAVCKNCGAAVRDRYCGSCGQRVAVGIPSLWALIADALENLYDLDSRVWRSLLPLLFRPGKMTADYLAGRRAFYLPPFRMYLTLSLVFFLVVSISDEEPLFDRDPTAAQGSSDAASIELDNEAAEAEPSVQIDTIERQVSEQIEAAMQAAKNAGSVPQRTPPEDVTVGVFMPSGSIGVTCDEDLPGYIGPVAQARLRQACEKIKADSGSSFSRALSDNIPLMMFSLIPLVAVIMKVLYPFARRKYVEHLLFLLHFHAFFFLLMILQTSASLLAAPVTALDFGVDVLTVVMWIYLPLYLFLAMRHVYRQGRLATTFKYLLLCGGYVGSLLLTFIGVLIYTALTL